MQGLDITPRFNTKITSLIYYAQSSSDLKIKSDLEKYFTEDKIFFRSDVEGKKNVDYSLKDPRT